MADFNPNSVDLDTADPAQIICYLNSEGNEYDGRLGLRLSALFVILVTSTLTTVLPVAASHKHLRIPQYGYLFARYFGAGVIIATAFIHLLEPAFEAIGPASCVGMTGGWAEYSWPPAIAMTSAMLLFLVDYIAHIYVHEKYGGAHESSHDVEHLVTDAAPAPVETIVGKTVNADDVEARSVAAAAAEKEKKLALASNSSATSLADSTNSTVAFQEQIAAFLILEFGVIFHSIIIGLALSVAGEEFNTLYPVIVFHQAFEGLGIGARLSVIPFPARWRLWPYGLCLAYGLCTPIAIAIGLGLREQYASGSFNANVVSGLFDSISAGILLYTGFVEMLARDFMMQPGRVHSVKRTAFTLVSMFLGCAIMALLGKWA